jgi:hypothetical protein
MEQTIMSAQLTLNRHATGLFTGVTERSTTAPTKDGIVIGLLAAALIGLIIADTATTESARSASVSATAAPVQNVAAFTGTYENGVPVYRLAPIEVTAVRVASAPK